MANVSKAESGAAVKPSILERAREYFLTLKIEWSKITYPDRKQLIQSTTVVFVFVIAFIAIIAVYDLLVGTFFHRLVFTTAGGQ